MTDNAKIHHHDGQTDHAKNSAHAATEASEKMSRQAHDGSTVKQNSSTEKSNSTNKTESKASAHNSLPDLRIVSANTDTKSRSGKSENEPGQRSESKAEKKEEKGFFSTFTGYAVDGYATVWNGIKDVTHAVDRIVDKKLDKACDDLDKSLQNVGVKSQDRVNIRTGIEFVRNNGKTAEGAVLGFTQCAGEIVGDLAKLGAEIQDESLKPDCLQASVLKVNPTEATQRVLDRHFGAPLRTWIGQEVKHYSQFGKDAGGKALQDLGNSIKDGATKGYEHWMNCSAEDRGFIVGHDVAPTLMAAEGAVAIGGNVLRVAKAAKTVETVAKTAEVAEAVAKSTETVEAVAKSTESVEAVAKSTESVEAAAKSTESVKEIPRLEPGELPYTPVVADAELQIAQERFTHTALNAAKNEVKQFTQSIKNTLEQLKTELKTGNALDEVKSYKKFVKNEFLENQRAEGVIGKKAKPAELEAKLGEQYGEKLSEFEKTHDLKSRYVDENYKKLSNLTESILESDLSAATLKQRMDNFGNALKNFGLEVPEGVNSAIRSLDDAIKSCKKLGDGGQGLLGRSVRDAGYEIQKSVKELISGLPGPKQIASNLKNSDSFLSKVAETRLGTSPYKGMNVDQIKSAILKEVEQLEAEWDLALSGRAKLATELPEPFKKPDYNFSRSISEKEIKPNEIRKGIPETKGSEEIKGVEKALLEATERTDLSGDLTKFLDDISSDACAFKVCRSGDNVMAMVVEPSPQNNCLKMYVQFFDKAGTAKTPRIHVVQNSEAGPWVAAANGEAQGLGVQNAKIENLLTKHSDGSAIAREQEKLLAYAGELAGKEPAKFLEQCKDAIEALGWTDEVAILEQFEQSLIKIGFGSLDEAGSGVKSLMEYLGKSISKIESAGH